MRIKINDKIYRLKEIESGVDSLMELVEETKYKHGDFVYEDNRIMIVKSYPNNYHAKLWYIYSEKPSYDSVYAVNFSSPTFRYATDEEKKLLIDAMKKDGKRWNSEKLEIEDIPKRKFKAGDKVRIKDGISSKTHRRVSPNFIESMNKFIGKELTVKKYNDFGWVEFYEDDFECQFHEDWLEPYSDEPKVGDWVIFWEVSPKSAKVGILTGIRSDSVCKYRIDEGIHWMHAIKWDGTKEHLEEVRKDKI